MALQPRMPLTIEVERGPDAMVVRLAGAATIDQADRLSYRLHLLAEEPVRRMVIDLTPLEFICSMGLGALIVAHVVSQRRNAQVVLAGPRPAIREILETTRLNMVFPIFADLASALKGAD